MAKKTKLFELSNEQKQEIMESINVYVENVKNPHLKNKYLARMYDIEFKKALITAFAEINFLSQTFVLNIKKMFDENVVYATILKESKKDSFEVQELKTYLINSFLSENLPKKYIDENFNEYQLRLYRNKMAEFKKDYINLFGEV